jgi:hypothetical protein
MPKTLTDNSATFPAQTAPAGGESRTATSIETPLQNAADRAAYLKARLDIIDYTGDGVRLIRRVDSLNALKAITDLTEKGIIFVDGIGLYQYLSGSTAPALDPLVVPPTIMGGAPGRWLWEGHGSLDIADGIPRLDGNARLATTKLAASGGGAKILAPSVVNGLVGTFCASAAGPATTTSTTYVTVTGSTITLTLEIGDLVVIVGQAEKYQQDLTPAIHYTQWLVTLPSAATATVAQTETRNKADALNEYASLSIGTYYTASAAGSHSFALQQKSEAGSGGATVAVKNLNVVALHVRP